MVYGLIHILSSYRSMGYVFQPWSFLDISISLSYISGLKVVGIPPELGLRDNNRYHGDSPMPIAVRLFKKGTYGRYLRFKLEHSSSQQGPYSLDPVNWCIAGNLVLVTSPSIPPVT